MGTLGFFIFSFLSTLLFFLLVSAFSEIPDQTAYTNSVRILSKPLLCDDGRIYACSDNDFFSFETNGSIAWSVHLNFKCHTGLSPVYAGTGQILVLAENRILRVSFQRNGTSNRSVPEVFFDPGETILGFAVSTSSSSVYITVKNHGLYAYNMIQQQLWIAEPKFERFGYRLGCRRDFQDCSFNSRPVIDACEASIYISNNQGELYSLSLRGPHFQWIQDFSSVDRFFTVTPGNNGLVYVVFQVKSLVLALDSFTGNILWQKNVGPLAAYGCDPVVDSNGWISIGSLDGSLYSFSRAGNLRQFPKRLDGDYVIQVDPLLDCSGNAVYISRTKMEGKVDRIIGEYTYVSAKKPETAVFTLLVPETGSLYFSKSYPDQISILLSEKDLQHFVLDERIVLAFVAASKTGNPLRCRSKHEKLASSCSLAQPEHLDIYIGNERAIIWFILFEFVIMMLFAGLVRFCCMFWKKKKLQEQPLRSFLEKRRSLQQKKKQIDRTITELQKEASSSDEMIEKIEGLVQEKENVKRKLSSTYGLGRDEEGSKSKGSILPLYGGDSRSFSFRSSEPESVSIFQTPTDESSLEDSWDDDDDARVVDDDDEDGVNLDRKLKGKMLCHSEGSYDDDEDDDYDDHNDNDNAWSVPSSSRSNTLKMRVLSSIN